MVSSEFLTRLESYGLTTAEIHYRIPDHPKLLQLFVWQEYDLAPAFPGLNAFLEYWQKDRTRRGVGDPPRVRTGLFLRPRRLGSSIKNLKAGPLFL